MKRRREAVEITVARLLKKQGLTLSVGESCTGGLLGHRITNVPGSSDYFRGGVVAYGNDLKIKILHVPSKVLKQFGAVSEETAVAMARGARKYLDSDIGIGITGIAGPTGGSRRKPVGTVLIAISSRSRNICVKSLFQGAREDIKRRASQKALKMLREFLITESDAGR